MRASDRAYAALRSEIVGWRIEPGTSLAEVELAERLGVSRTPVREALARLMADGLVAPVGGRGLVVSPFSLAEVELLYELRIALETQASRLAAARRDAAVFEQLADEFAHIADMLGGEGAGRTDYYSLVERFDLAIDDAVGNRYLVAELRGMRAHVARARRITSRSDERLSAAAAEHLAIVRAIVEGDGELAAAATFVHLRNAIRAMRATVTETEPAEAGRSNRS